MDSYYPSLEYYMNYNRALHRANSQAKTILHSNASIAVWSDSLPHVQLTGTCD